MAIFQGKDGKKKYHPNPQMGKALYGGGSLGDVKPGHMKNEEKLEEKVDPGIHKKVAELEQGHEAAHHVEIHHGGHPHGEPPMHEGHTHHTVVHHHTGEASIHNHENYDEAEAHTRDAMGENTGDEGSERELGSVGLEAPSGNEGSEFGE